MVSTSMKLQHKINGNIYQWSLLCKPQILGPLKVWLSCNYLYFNALITSTSTNNVSAHLSMVVVYALTNLHMGQKYHWALLQPLNMSY